MVFIATERLILRPLILEDASSMFAYASDPEITKYLPWDTHRTIQDSIDFLHIAIEDQKKTPLYPLGITFRDQPENVIGTVGLKQSVHPYQADLSYVLGRVYWRQGIMYEATQALLRLGFEEYGFKRIYAWCIKENAPSSSLMQKLGMQFEGRFRDNAYRHGQLWDVDYYSILANEWFSRSA